MQFPYSFGDVGFSGVKTYGNLSVSGTASITLGLLADATGVVSSGGVGDIALPALLINGDGLFAAPVAGTGDLIIPVFFHATDARAITGVAGLTLSNLVVEGERIYPHGSADVRLPVNVSASGGSTVIGLAELTKWISVSGLGYIPVKGNGEFFLGRQIQIGAAGNHSYTVSGNSELKLTVVLSAIAEHASGHGDVVIPTLVLGATGSANKPVGVGRFGTGDIKLGANVSAIGQFFPLVLGASDINLPGIVAMADGKFTALTLGIGEIILSGIVQSFGHFPNEPTPGVTAKLSQSSLVCKKTEGRIYAVV